MAIDSLVITTLNDSNEELKRLLTLESVADEKATIDGHARALEALISQLNGAAPEQIEDCKQILNDAHDLLQRCLEKAELEKKQVVAAIVKIKKTNSTKKHLETYKSLKET